MTTRSHLASATRRRAAVAVCVLLAAVCANAQAPEDPDIAAIEAAAPVAAQTPRRSDSGPIALEVPARASPEHRAHNLFASRSWYTPPPAPSPRPAAPVAPPEPTAPALPFAYMGSLEQGNGTVYFLAEGDRAYDVKIGDVLDATYRVDGVSNGRLMFTYLPLKTSQGLQIGEQK